MAHGPWWVAAGLLAGVSLTALYTFRVVWLVFVGATTDRRGSTANHGVHFVARQLSVAGRPLSASGVALTLLAFGTLTIWLLAGPLGYLLATTLPFHNLRCGTTSEVCRTIVTTPTSAVVLASASLGLAAWWWRDRLGWLTGRLGWVARAATAECGLDVVNRQITRLVRRAADGLRVVETGQLNWNMVGLAGGLVIVLAILAWGG
jgi:hypothetical protein